jgi:hypothetical protein
MDRRENLIIEDKIEYRNRVVIVSFLYRERTYSVLDKKQRVDADTVVNAVASLIKVSGESVRARVAGRQPANLPRKVALYGCHDYADRPLKAMARYVGLGHTGSVVWCGTGYQKASDG